jgi:HPt (histidine-containing phosphotransfer) domain-containing protein
MNRQSARLSQVGVNVPELLLRVENDLDLLDELIVIFNEEFPPLLQVLRAAIAREDLKKVEVTSHSLKGMLSGLSVTRASEIASRLEQAAREGNPSAFRDELILLEGEVANLVPELDAFTLQTKP